MKQQVCTTDEAREYFKKNVGTYANVTQEDIYILIKFLRKEISKSNESGETSIGLHLSKTFDLTCNDDGTIKSCFIFISSSYFDARECISFNSDGFIGFAGWASTANVNPILRAFLKWCNFLKEISDDRFQIENLELCGINEESK